MARHTEGDARLEAEQPPLLHARKMLMLTHKPRGETVSQVTQCAVCVFLYYYYYYALRKRYKSNNKHSDGKPPHQV